MKKKPTFNDFNNARPTELMKTYKMNARQLEMAHRNVMYGANQQLMRSQYDKFYRRNRKDA